MTVIDSLALSVIILKWQAGLELFKVLRQALFVRLGACKEKACEDP
jgi:hypothetical protein